VSSKIENPFDLTLQEFIHLDAHSKRKIFINAAQLNSSFVNSYFRKHPEIDWLVIAQKKNNIVESGSRENEPYEQYLAENIEFRSSLIPDKKSSKSQRFNKLIPF